MKVAGVKITYDKLDMGRSQAPVHRAFADGQMVGSWQAGYPRYTLPHAFVRGMLPAQSRHLSFNEWRKAVVRAAIS